MVKPDLAIALRQMEQSPAPSLAVALKQMEKVDWGSPIECVAGDQIVNGGAETGDTTGWTATNWTATNSDKYEGVYCFTSSTAGATLSQDVDMPLSCIGYLTDLVETAWKCPGAGSSQFFLDATFSSGFTYTALRTFGNSAAWSFSSSESLSYAIINEYVSKKDTLTNITFRVADPLVGGAVYLDSVLVKTSSSASPASSKLLEALRQLEKVT